MFEMFDENRLKAFVLARWIACESIEHIIVQLKRKNVVVERCYIDQIVRRYIDLQTENLYYANRIARARED